jgi:omega-hydroxy-beta-dihydromenaquinone-9 sulfotransferase
VAVGTLGHKVASSNASPGAGPIVIAGTGRCGSTMLHRLLALHDDVGWLSTFNETFPTQTWLSIFSGLYRSPLPRPLKDMKAFPKPFEAYRFWDRYLPGFSRRDRPQTADDVPAGGINPVRRATARVLKLQRKSRLLVKVTGWSRIAYFDRIYPDAVFVSLRREPRSVISSWVKAGWLDVTSPPDSEEWQWGEVPPAYGEVWRELGGDAVLTAALKMRLDLDDIARNMALFPDRCHELWYEDLIANPKTTVRAICDFADLEWTARFERVVGAMSFYDTTSTWRQHLTEEQGDLVLEFLRRTDAFAESQGTAASAAIR